MPHEIDAAAAGALPAKSAEHGVSFGSPVSPAPVDPMNVLRQRLESDKHPGIIDLGAGVYRDNEGQYYEFEAIKKVGGPDDCLT